MSTACELRWCHHFFLFGELWSQLSSSVKASDCDKPDLVYVSCVVGSGILVFEVQCKEPSSLGNCITAKLDWDKSDVNIIPKGDTKRATVNYLCALLI